MDSMKSAFGIIAFVFVSMMVSCGTKEEEKKEYISECTLPEPPKLDKKLPLPPDVEQVRFLPPEIKADKEVNSVQEEASEIIPLNSIVQKQLKIIKDGDISIRSKDVALSKKHIDNLLTSFNAYYEKEELQNNEQSVSYEFTIRIPSAHFEKAIQALENSNDEILSKNIQARDVTEEFTDLEIRLNNKRDFLQRYKELLLRAGTVKEILAIEENIRILVEEIESAEGRIKYLGDKVAYSTLNVSLFKEKAFVFKAEPQDSFVERLKKSASIGWTAIIDFVVWFISVWPYIVLVSIVVFLIKRAIKRRKSAL